MMVTNVAAGLRLGCAPYAVLQEVLGSRPADTLMEMIPQSEQLATKTDLEATTTALRSEMRDMRRELKAEMSDIRFVSS